MVYFIVFFACVLLVLTALSFNDTRGQIQSSTSMYLGSAASSIASVTDWNYISTLSPGNESSARYMNVIEMFTTTQERYPDIKRIFVLEKTPGGYVYLADSAWGTPEGHAIGSPLEDGPANIGTLFNGAPYGALPVGRNDPLYGSAPIRDADGQVRAIVLIEADNAGYQSSMDRIGAIQFVLLIILPALVIVTVLRSEQILNRLRKSIQKSEAEYHSIVESTSDSISIVDRTGHYLFMNSRYRDQLGLKADPKKGATYGDFHTGIGTTNFLEDVSTVFATGTMLTKERWYSTRSLLQVLNPVIDPESGRVIAVTEILRDVTDQKAIERALTENEKRYRLLLLNANDTIILFEPAGDTAGRIIEVNQIATAMFGYSTDEFLRMNVRDFNVSKSKDKYQEIYQRLLSTSHAVFETELPTKAGKLLPVEISARLFTFKDKPMVLASIRDISQRKAAEREMQESLQEKQLLLKEIHHRVKNNLQVIISLLNLQSRYVTDPAVLSVITESQHRIKAMALVHEQLYQSRNFAGINIREYTQSLTGNLVNTFNIPSRKIEIAIKIYEDVWINIDSAIPLGLIISELVSNALKYAFPNSRSGRIEISLDKDAEKFILVVKDNGIGMPPDFDWDTARSLGLRLIRMLTRQLNGSITQLSGEGTGFRIEFVPKGSGLDEGTAQDSHR